MISVLIPVYNYNIVSLVNEIHKQLAETDVAFEILAYDDGSENYFIDKNFFINDLSFTTFHVSSQNMGREQTRQILSQNAVYNWLLFLDADTAPVPKTFIENYLSYTGTAYDAVFGGIRYQEAHPENDYLLRWTYGTACEAIGPLTRNKKTYRHIVSANFIIRKKVFLELNKHIVGKEYGYDILFAALLKAETKKIWHIDNPVYHLGIEKSALFLSKSEAAVTTYLTLLKTGNISRDDNRLLFLFSTLKRYKLNIMVAHSFKYIKPSITQNLLGRNPNVLLFQLYKLAYMCFVDLKISGSCHSSR